MIIIIERRVRKHQVKKCLKTMTYSLQLEENSEPNQESDHNNIYHIQNLHHILHLDLFDHCHRLKPIQWYNAIYSKESITTLLLGFLSFSQHKRLNDIRLVQFDDGGDVDVNPGAHVQLGRQRNPLSHSSPTTSTIPFPQYCAMIIIVVMLRQNELVTLQL